jgi:hypothetical protein
VFPANAYVIRRADADDAAALRELAVKERCEPISIPALIGELDGQTAAAVSIADGRVVADQSKHTRRLAAVMSMRARSLRAAAEMPSLRDRMRAGVRVTGVWAAKA